MSEKQVEDILIRAVENADGEGPDPNNLSLDALILLINAERLKLLQEKTNAEFSELKKRQEKVAELHKILKAINAATNSKGELDISKNPELKEMLKKAKELGVDVKDDKTSYNKDQRDRLVENIRMTVEDLNVQNDMQLQTISRLTNERYESYQMARSILKPLNDAKTSHAKAMRGA